MSSGYLLLFFFCCFFLQDKKILSILTTILFVFMIRGYIVQDSATYQTLEHTYNKTYHIACDNKKSTTELGEIANYTYGFVSNHSLFWNEYTNMKNGWSRFMEGELGSPITFVSLETYQEILESKTFQEMNCYPDKESIQVINDIIVVKLSN